MSDDDVPELAYSSASEDESSNNTGSNNEGPAAKWLNYVQKSSSRSRQERVIKTLIMGPFLFGRMEQPDKWIRFCEEVKLLEKDGMYVDVLSDDQLHNVEIVEAVLETVIPQLFLRDTVSSILDMMQKAENWDSAKQCISAAESNKYTQSWFSNTSKKKTEGDKVYMCIVFVCRQYVDHVNQYVKSGVDKTAEFEAQFAKEPIRKKIDEIRSLGNTEFKNQNYLDAISQYSSAIAFDYYNHVLYGNRAQAYLNNKQYRKALSDGKRAVVLKPDWAKGYYRYAQAFYELGRFEDGINVNHKAREVCDRRAKDYSELDAQRIRFQEKLREVVSAKENRKDGKPLNPVSQNGQVNGNINNIDDEVPDLVSSDGASDDSDSDLETIPKKKKTSESKNKPKLVRLQPYTVSCENEFSGESDSDDMPPLKSDVEEEEEDQSKMKYKNLKKKEVSTKPLEKLAEKSSSKSAPVPPPPVQPQRDRSAHKQKKEEKKKEEKKKEEKKSDKKQAKSRAEQKENIKPEQTRPEPKPALDPRVVQLQERKSELESLMARASDALLSKQSHMAIKVFGEVLDMFTKFHHDYFGKDQSEVLLVRYCLGKASVDTGEDVLILEGIDHYQTILKVSKNVKFPLGYLGLGEAYFRQNRWELALPEFRRGLNLVIAGSYSRIVLNWPGTRTVIPETQPGKLREAFEEYIATCNNPPKPDAICRYAECSGHYKIQIYLTDPDFKGYVRVKCFAQCMVEYHTECWKKVRSLSKERHSDKDLLNGPCFTPDCISTISMIIIFDDAGNPLREIEATRPQNRICAAKKVEKIQASSVAKISRKQEKKRIRKERKEEEKRKRREELESEKLLAQIDNMQEKASIRKPIELEGAAAAAAAAPIAEETKAANSVNLEKLTMLKKLDSDSDDEISYKVSKKSKKKKKQTRDKRVITMGTSYFENANPGEVANSSKTNDKAQIPAASTGMDGLDDFDDVGNSLNRGLDNANPFSVPDSIRNDVVEFERSLPPQKLDKLGDPIVEEQYLAKNKDIKEGIFNLFAILLKESGPLHVSDTKIEDEVDNFPEEARNLIQSAGGIGHFLSKSLQFFHMDGYVCLMVDAPKAQSMARTNKQQGVEGQVSKNRTRALPPDTRSRDQFPTLGATASEDSAYSQYHKNHADALQNQQTVRAALRDNLLRRDTSTPDSECTSSSDPLDNFLLSAQLSQTLSQSSMDDREKTDVLLATLNNKDNVDDLKSPLTTSSVASSNLFMPSAYGDSKSQESNISDSLGSGFMSSIIPNMSSQASIESSSEVGIGLSVDTTKEDLDTTPPMTSPGLIHDIMGAKPLNYLSLSDHPLLKAPINNDAKPQESSILEEKRNGDLGESPNREEQETETLPVDYNVVEPQNEQSSPLPEARLNREPLPHSSPVHRKMDLLEPGPRLTPEQATITPPRPRNTSPKAHEPEFNILGSVLPPHPDMDVSSMDSLISMPTTSLVNTSVPAWMNADITANLGSVNSPADLGLSSPSRSVGFHRGSSLPPHPSEVDEQLKQEIAEDVFNTMSQYSAFRDNPDLKKNILSDIEKDFQSASEHSGSVSPARSFKFGKYAESDGLDKAAQTEQDMVSRGTNTEGENYEPLYQRAMMERNHMQAQLQDLLDKYTQLQKNSQVSVSTVLGQLEENRLQTQGELRAAQETMQRMKIEHQAEMQKLQHQLKMTKELEETLSVEIGSREQKIAELSRKLTEEENNQLQMQQIITTYQEAQIREHSRAQAAEIHFLELKRDIGAGIMERSFKDAESWIRNCAVQLRMYAQQKREPPPQIATVMSQWKETADKIKQIKTQSTDVFNEQINKVRSGEQLSDLPVIPIPHPPPPPEALQGGPQGEPRFPNPTMMNMRPPGFGSNARMPSPTGTTSPLTVQPAPASLAALASQSNLNTQTVPSRAQASFSSNAADKNKAKSLANREVNTVRVERQRNSFIKLMDALGKIFPNYTREELDEYVKRLRSSRGGSLNGMGMDEIVTQVSDMIFRDQQTKMSKYNPQGVQSLPLVSNLVRRSSTPEIYDEEEDPCTICHEEMKPGTTKMLECKHYFHDRCIRKWYREKNECPICRKYAPLDDEFPAL